MKLIMAIIRERDQWAIQDNLLEIGVRFTCVASTGGFLREGNLTLMVGANEWEVEPALDVIRACCQGERETSVWLPAIGPLGAATPGKVTVTGGGAVIFVMDIERFEKM
ncbi:MAG: cyclic-di-AMP receptor [Armatimonadota bacterium]